MIKYDFIIVGTGLFGSIFAREMTDKGASCLVLEKRNHIGGNCYTENIEGINVHKYGPHIFHTNSDYVWNYIKKWTEFNNFVNRPKVNYQGKLYSFPINLFTLYQLWGTKTPQEAQQKLNDVKIKIQNPSNLEEWILSQVGEEIYQKFVYGYTKKQWGKHPNELPSFIIKRLPIRLTFDDNYFEDKYQGIPIGGYTNIFKKMLANIPIEYNTDYLKDRERWNLKADKIVYTGAIDEFFNYDIGVLEWRSLRFENELLNINDYQGNAIINYTEEMIPYTRICEHKHFENIKSDSTLITKEYPQNWSLEKEKYYPVNDEKNNKLYSEYKEKIDHSKYIFGGRLANYKYYDMHQVVAEAITQAKKQDQK
jgi:UDP-galactopyranose mutase